MKKLFTSLKGMQILLQVVTLAVNVLVFADTVVEEPVKEI